MKPRDCRRFERLSAIDDGEGLSLADIEFLESHRAACPECEELMQAQVEALDLMRGMSFSEDTDPLDGAELRFEDRIVRNLFLANRRDTWTYWWPAGLGAAIAALAAFAALQLAAGRAEFRPMFFHGQEAANGMPSAGSSLSIIRQYDR